MRKILKRLRAEEDGLALTEYLILLGLMTGGVLLSISLFATALADAWTGSMRALTFTSATASQGDPSGTGAGTGTGSGTGGSTGGDGVSGNSSNSGNSGSSGSNGNGGGNGNGNVNGRGRN